MIEWDATLSTALFVEYTWNLSKNKCQNDWENIANNLCLFFAIEFMYYFISLHFARTDN